MEYLAQNTPVFSRDLGDGWTAEYQHDEVVYDAYNSVWFDIHTNMEVEATRERPAEWWAVAVYTSVRAYGGPEEGGWWYTCGELVEHHRIRFFDDYAKAQEYQEELWDWCYTENKDRGDIVLSVHGFTEQMPYTFYPKTRPHYS